MTELEAKGVRDLALEAVDSLARAAKELDPGEDISGTVERVRKGIGIAIGTIQVSLLEVLYEQFPEIDDTKSRG